MRIVNRLEMVHVERSDDQFAGRAGLLEPAGAADAQSHAEPNGRSSRRERPDTRCAPSLQRQGASASPDAHTLL